MRKNITNDDNIFNKLKKVSIFQVIAGDDEIMKKIYSRCKHRKIKKNETLIEEGNTGDELFFILSGKISILKKTLQSEKYTVASLDADERGIAVGELAMIDSDKRSATVVAETDCEYMVINRENFIKFGDENPEAGLQMTRVIAGRLSSQLRKANTDVITLFSALVTEISEE